MFVAVLVGAALADPYRFVADDAGITLRYAERLAEGKGFGYNDGEAINGCSNPLYMLAQAGLLALGVAPYAAIQALAAFGLAGTTALLFLTFARFWSLGAACVAVVATLTVLKPFQQLYDGLEPPFVALFAALLFRALHSPSPAFHGVALGLLVANKLDGGIAALAYAAVYVARHRRLPWRTALVATATAAPMFAFLLIVTGSLLPNSMVTKLTWHAGMYDLDPLWMHEILMLPPFRWLYLAAWLSIPVLAFQRDERRWAVRAIQAWFVLHLVTYAWVNLGAPMLWYAIGPRVHAVILSACLVHQLGTWAARAAPRLAPRLARGLVTGAAVAALAFGSGDELARHLRAPRVPHGLLLFSAFDLGRQAAGAWLREHTSGTELLSDFQGLSAFEYGGPVYDTALLNSRRDDRVRDSSAYHLMGPTRATSLPRWKLGDMELVATFQYDRRCERFELYARPGSEILQRGLRHLVLPFRATRRAEEGRQRVGIVRGALVLATQDVVDVRVEAPAPPTLLMTARAGDLPEGARVALAIRAGDQVLWRGELRPGDPPTPVRVSAPLPTENAAYRFVLRASSDHASERGVLIEELLIRVGEPLRSEDFKLSSPRTRARVDHVADVGLPFNLVTR